MAKFELRLPKMGESVAEATITSWLKEVGDTIEEDEAILEIATDKVDSEIPSEVEGVLVEKLFNVDDVIQVGQTIAIIETDANEALSASPAKVEEIEQEPTNKEVAEVVRTIVAAKETVAPVISNGDRFYSPLVKNIAKKENITQSELDVIIGTGKKGRVTKNDILAYLQSRESQSVQEPKIQQEKKVDSTQDNRIKTTQVAPIVSNGEDEIIEMTRMGKLVAKHMVDSVQTSAHVQSFIEADVTKIWNWRAKVKDEFKNREGENFNLHSNIYGSCCKSIKRLSYDEYFCSRRYNY